MIPIWLAHAVLAPPVEGCESVGSACVRVERISESPLAGLMAKKRCRFFRVMWHLSMFVCVYVCQCAFFVLMCVVILQLCCCSLMTRAAPGSRGCHSVVTNSLGRLAAAKAPTPAKPLCTRHSNTHTYIHTARKTYAYIQTHHSVSCCLDSSKCVYVAVDGRLKTLLWIYVSAG